MVPEETTVVTPAKDRLTMDEGISPAMRLNNRVHCDGASEEMVDLTNDDEFEMLLEASANLLSKRKVPGVHVGSTAQATTGELNTKRPKLDSKPELSSARADLLSSVEGVQQPRQKLPAKGPDGKLPSSVATVASTPAPQPAVPLAAPMKPDGECQTHTHSHLQSRAAPSDGVEGVAVQASENTDIFPWMTKFDDDETYPNGPDGEQYDDGEHLMDVSRMSNSNQKINSKANRTLPPSFSNRRPKDVLPPGHEISSARPGVESSVHSEEETDVQHVEMFTEYSPTYIPGKFPASLPHPDELCESGSLAAVGREKPTYPLDETLEDVINEGRISQAQAEAVWFACDSHMKFLTTGERQGFLIGDGAGVGKGREIAAILLDSWLRGRKKHVWISVSKDLAEDARRDLREIGAEFIRVENLVSYRYDSLESQKFHNGVLYSTYSSLISNESRRRKLAMKENNEVVDKTASNTSPSASAMDTQKYGEKNYGERSRLVQIIDWLTSGLGPNKLEAFDGVIVFDECHKAKGLFSAAGKPTKTGQAVLDLQRALPNARIVYASATGASQVDDMAYMTRLGIWGSCASFHNFEQFRGVMLKAGLASMELLATNLKRNGCYIARTLSYKGAEFEIVEVDMVSRWAELYRKSAELWAKILNHLNAHGPGSDMATSKKLYWSTHQRFFKQLLMAAKVDQVVAMTQAALKDNKSVVIALQTTGEAAFCKQLELNEHDLYVDAEGDKVFRKLPSSVAGTIQQFLRKFVPNSYLLQREAAALDLPVNVLDSLVDRLGGPEEVAEMTGRVIRVVKEDDRYVLRRRNHGSDAAVDKINLAERSMFMKGEKLVAITSEAASTGVSLQADKRVSNQRRRIHIILELPWSADRAIQQFGRTHRSNQSTSPEYKLLMTTLGGEKRFASAVARKMETLGALMKGDKRAACGLDLGIFNLQTRWGEKALKEMLAHTLSPERALNPSFMEGATPELKEQFLRELHQFLMECEVLTDGLPFDSQKSSVKRFLNRILGIAVDQQNKLFTYFMDYLSDILKKAENAGDLQNGLQDLAGACTVEKIKLMMGSEDDNSGIREFEIISDRGFPWSEVHRIYEEVKQETFARSTYRTGFYVRTEGNKSYVMFVRRDPQDRKRFLVYKPHLGRSTRKMCLSDFYGSSFRRVDRVDQAERLWTNQYKSSDRECGHDGMCTSCHVRRRRHYILAGNLIHVWYFFHERFGKKMHLVRVQAKALNEGELHRIVGISLPKASMQQAADIIMDFLVTDAETAATPTGSRTVPPVDVHGKEMVKRNVGSISKGENVSIARNTVKPLADPLKKTPRPRKGPEASSSLHVGGTSSSSLPSVAMGKRWKSPQDDLDLGVDDGSEDAAKDAGSKAIAGEPESSPPPSGQRRVRSVRDGTFLVKEYIAVIDRAEIAEFLPSLKWEKGFIILTDIAPKFASRNLSEGDHLMSFAGKEHTFFKTEEEVRVATERSSGSKFLLVGQKLLDSSEEKDLDKVVLDAKALAEVSKVALQKDKLDLQEQKVAAEREYLTQLSAVKDEIVALERSMEPIQDKLLAMKDENLTLRKALKAQILENESESQEAMAEELALSSQLQVAVDSSSPSGKKRAETDNPGEKIRSLRDQISQLEENRPILAQNACKFRTAQMSLYAKEAQRVRQLLRKMMEFQLRRNLSSNPPGHKVSLQFEGLRREAFTIIFPEATEDRIGDICVCQQTLSDTEIAAIFQTATAAKLSLSESLVVSDLQVVYNPCKEVLTIKGECKIVNSLREIAKKIRFW